MPGCARAALAVPTGRLGVDMRLSNLEPNRSQLDDIQYHKYRRVALSKSLR